MTITDERKEQVDFSDPYFDADQSLLVRADDAGDLVTLDDLAGETIGVQSGTTGETYAKENTPDGATIKSFEDADGLFAALTSGDIDAILQDFPVNAYRARRTTQFVVTETFPTGEAVRLRRGQGQPGSAGASTMASPACTRTARTTPSTSMYFGRRSS